MSAYIVDREVVNYIVSHLHSKALGSSGTWYSDYCILAQMGYRLSDTQACQRLAADLFNMNIEAVNQRYNDNTPKTQFNFDFNLGTRPMRTWRYMCELVYQCSEGNVPDTPLYKALTRMKGEIAENILRELPEMKEVRGW